jgi:ABC-2 type transport system permease protein
MTLLFRAEVLKLWTTRAAYAYLVAVVAISALRAAANASIAHLLELSDPAFQRDLISDSVTAPLFALLLGILSLTIEWRHGTITRTLLVTPRRWRVLAVKEVNAFVLGIELALVGLAVAIAVAAPILSHDGTPLDVNGAFLGRCAEIVLAAALWGALGVGFGGLVQSQAGALVGAIIWVFVVESVLELLLDWLNLSWITHLLPRHALDALAGGHDAGFSAGAGGAIGFGWVVLFAGLAFARIRRQDIT